MAQGMQSASSGAFSGSFPSSEAAVEAGAELAQKLGLSREEGVDRVVSAVLQQRGEGTPVLVTLSKCHFYPTPT